MVVKFYHQLIMAIPTIKPEIRLNDFTQVNCLSSKDIYKKMGARSRAASSCEEAANFSRNPLELSDIDMDAYDDMRRKEAQKAIEEARKQREKQESGEDSTE